MSQYTSAYAEEQKAAATAACVISSVSVTNVNTSNRYLYMFDHASAASGTRIWHPVLVAPTQTVVVDFEKRPRKTALGLFLACSSTQATFTASAGNDFIYDVDLLPADARVVAAERQQL